MSSGARLLGSPIPLNAALPDGRCPTGVWSVRDLKRGPHYLSPGFQPIVTVLQLLLENRAKIGVLLGTDRRVARIDVLTR